MYVLPMLTVDLKSFLILFQEKQKCTNILEQTKKRGDKKNRVVWDRKREDSNRAHQDEFLKYMYMYGLIATYKSPDCHLLVCTLCCIGIWLYRMCCISFRYRGS